MDARKQLLIINGQDKTDTVTRFQFQGDRCQVVFDGSPKVYSYHREKVQLLPLRQVIDPADSIVTVKGSPISGVEQVLDFGAFYRILRNGKRDLSVPRTEFALQRNCIADHKDLFEYFRETAAAISLVVGENINILELQYKRIEAVSEETVLGSYLNPDHPLKERALPDAVIYPFGLNQSQKTAVENALTHQVSIIQGPPGTGKTQTILNIIANLVRGGKTVAVVSNNNSATRNVAEKLEKKGVSFLTAFLGSLDNKNRFLENQTGQYPDMRAWELEPEAKVRLDQEVTALSQELREKFHDKNRIAEIEQELLQLKPEQHYFNEYYDTYGKNPAVDLSRLSSQKILSLWLEYEQHAEREGRLGPLKKLSVLFRFSPSALKLFARSPELVIPYLQHQFYETKYRELTAEREELRRRLEHYNFDGKMEELTEKSLRLFHAELAVRYPWQNRRQVFESHDFRRNSMALNQEYPVILSTTYSIKGTLNLNHIYDYLIVDEASQVDLATGVLALSCARNLIIVGDLQQLPNVLTEDDIRISNEIAGRYNVPEDFRFANHSLLSSALAVWKNAPVVLLREHYRCHPKIIHFCNRKFYNGKLIVMTEDHDETGVLTMYRTVAGNHARGHLNQRQIDVIRAEVLPRLLGDGYQNIGIITPYRDQVKAIREQLGNGLEVDTVHKFQGREKDAIILTSVDNVISDFVDDPRMLNVAVSRAVKALAVVTSQGPQNDRINYGDLARYIAYNNCEIVSSTVYSVFDLLYQGYAQERKAYLQRHHRVSEFDSENLLFSVIEELLEKPEYSIFGCAVHVSLVTLVKDFSILEPDEAHYAQNPLTHVDFLLFHQMDKRPLLAIEVDGTAFHNAGSKQAARDERKNQILKKCNLPLLRLRTDGSGEREKIEDALKGITGMLHI